MQTSISRTTSRVVFVVLQIVVVVFESDNQNQILIICKTDD